MATSVASGTAVENNLTGGSILYTDTGTYNTVSSRVLTVFNYLGAQIQQFNMGVNLTQVFTYPADDWFWFQCIVTDNTGTFTANVYVVPDGYYWVAYQNQYNASGCGCAGNNCNLEVSKLALDSALRSNLAGVSGAAVAHRDIIEANFFANQSIVSQLM